MVIGSLTRSGEQTGWISGLSKWIDAVTEHPGTSKDSDLGARSAAGIEDTDGTISTMDAHSRTRTDRET